MTLALQMFRSVPRHLAAKLVGGRLPGVLSSPAVPLRLTSIDAPKPVRSGWVPLKTRLSGICGSDLGMLSGRTSLYFSGLVSLPLVPGHEIVADVAEDVEGFAAGTRVVVDPVLTCRTRGVELCEPCAAGATNLCNHVTVGHISPGLQTGYCHDTGGGWSQQLTAHTSQLYAVPDALSDEQAVLVEPLACAVHTALRAGVREGDRVLVSGAGAVGLFATLALSRLTPAADIIVVAKHAHQRELALRFGATEVVAPGEVIRGVRRRTQAFQVKPQFSSHYLLGGVDVAVDAVGSSRSLETALQVTKPGGRVVISGMPSPADLSAAWFRELALIGTYASSSSEEGLGGRPAFEQALELAGDPQLAAALDDAVVSYPLYRWSEALDHAHSAGRLGTVKVAFDPRRTK